MTPDQFIAKWKAAELKERSAAQSHFNDLCRMLDEPGPTDADPKGEWYAFERGATKSTGGDGWADVWKRGHFGWEYKGKRKDLTQAFAQLQQYALALENPPLLVVCDLDQFRIRTNWTNSVSETHEIALEDLRDPAIRQKLKWVLSDPEKLRPGKTRQALTEQAASEFAVLAKRLRDRGHPAEIVAHFINRLIFCMFAEDVELLPKKLFARMLTSAVSRPEQFQARASELFRAMERGGEAAWEPVAWFNGGLFNDDTALPLDKDDIQLTLRAANLDWAEIDPSILGTLFERGLDPDKRSQLGAHYTDRDKIMLIVEPVIIRPWLNEWQRALTEIHDILNPTQSLKTATAREAARQRATSLYRDFLDRLSRFRVLDPACGSGNFLYLALLALKDIEHRAGIEVEALGLQREFPQIGPASVKGIEINPYAAELARVSVWIGEIQWMRRTGFGVSRDPILKPLATIECRDALLNPDGTEAIWPDADVVIGNPPFLGDRRMIGALGESYVTELRAKYADRIPGRSDLVCYWLAKGVDAIADGSALRVGLVATNSISGGNNLPTMERVTAQARIFEAWRDEPWVIEGASVRVAIVCFGRKDASYKIQLDGNNHSIIAPDLNSGFSLAGVVTIECNKGVSFIGTQKNGPFDVGGELARRWLKLPVNPNGRPNTDVVRPWTNGSGLVRNDEDRWIIDFGTNMAEQDAALYEEPFKFVVENVRPTRLYLRREWHRTRWWLHGDPRPALRRAVTEKKRFIATPLVSKHRIFVWLPKHKIPENTVIVIARDDDTSFGILHSRFHEAWSLRLCTWLGVGNDPRYTPSTTFETFPFPEGLTPNIPAEAYASDPRAKAIAAAASRLNDLRENWLNPADLVRREPEVVPGYPDRLLPVDERAAAILKKRTLTNLYNERPTWLANAHRDLDAAVAAAYGWPAEISEEDALAKLFALNQERASR